MTDLAWSIRHHEIGTRAVRGFTDAHRAREHARDHFLKVLERWDVLHPAAPPASFRARLDAGPEEIHRVLDEAVIAYESAVKACTAPRDSIELAARVLHRPEGSPRPVPRILVVSRKGVLAAFQPDVVSDLRSAYRPLPRQLTGAPTVTDYLREARADFARARAFTRRAQGRPRRSARRR